LLDRLLRLPATSYGSSKPQKLSEIIISYFAGIVIERTACNFLIEKNNIHVFSAAETEV